MQGGASCQIGERLVSAYNDPNLPQAVRQSVLEHPRETLPLLPHVRRMRRGSKEDADPGALAGQRMRSVLAMLFHLAGEAEGLLATLSPVDRHNLKQMLNACVEADRSPAETPLRQALEKKIKALLEENKSLPRKQRRNARDI